MWIADSGARRRSRRAGSQHCQNVSHGSASIEKFSSSPDHRYIKNTEYVREATVECNLTALCLQYLTFECFNTDIRQDELRQFALEGYFAFQDYAIAKWFHHFRAMVVAGQDLFLGDSDARKALEDIHVVLEEFSSNYEDDIL